MSRLRFLLVLIVISTLLSVVGYAAYELESRPITSVRVAGELRHTSRADLEAVVAEHITASLYRVDVNAIRQAALSLPWVKDTSVRRAWPDSLHLAVIEREPVARWPEGGLVEGNGEVFYPGSTAAFSHLPLLEGPPGSTSRMLEKYWSLQMRLRPAGWEINRLALNRRGSWYAELNDRILMVLGQEPSEVAVQRFVSAFETVLASRIDELVQVDLRYTNGFSIRWKSLEDRKTQSNIQGEEGQG